MANRTAVRALRLGLTFAFGIGVGIFCICCLVSVFSGAKERMGSRPASAPEGLVDRAAIASCFHDLEGLWGELNSHLDATLSSSAARRSGSDWADWSPGWRSRVLTIGARCRLEEGDGAPPERETARGVYRGLLELHRHYTTLATQFASEIGPGSDKLRRAIDEGRAIFSAGP